MASNSSPREPVIALLRERLAHRDAGSAELDEAYIAHEDHDLELELFYQLQLQVK